MSPSVPPPSDSGEASNYAPSSDGLAALAQFERKAGALLEAYTTGTPEALERHYALTWHRRPWRAMRSYVQLELGKRPTGDADDVDITLADAKHLIALEHRFENWDALRSFALQQDTARPMAAVPVEVRRPRGVTPGVGGNSSTMISSRDWNAVLETLASHPGAELDAHGQMTDEMLQHVAAIPHVAGLRLSNSKFVTDAGVRFIGRMPELRTLDLSHTRVTNDGLRVLRDLPALQSLSLVMTMVTDEAADHVAWCDNLERLTLMWTRTGDGMIRALAGKRRFTHLLSGNNVTDAGVVALHDIPAFKRWRGGTAHNALLGHQSYPNELELRGTFSDSGLEQLRDLEGLFSLNIDAGESTIGSVALETLASLPHLGALSLDAHDDLMPFIARMPALQFLSVQDTTASDDGWNALAASETIEILWGRRCHGLTERGFKALGHMPKLRGLSVSCRNVSDDGIAMLPHFPALRELMPMDIHDAGYRHIGECRELEALLLMYCRDTTDEATSHITGLERLRRYFNSYTTITDHTPRLLSRMDSLEEITFDACNLLTNDGVAHLARLPRLRELQISGDALTPSITEVFPAGVEVRYSP